MGGPGFMRFNLKVYSESAGVSDWQADAASAEEASRQAGVQGFVLMAQCYTVTGFDSR